MSDLGLLISGVNRPVSEELNAVDVCMAVLVPGMSAVVLVPAQAIQQIPSQWLTDMVTWFKKSVPV